MTLRVFLRTDALCLGAIVLSLGLNARAEDVHVVGSGKRVEQRTDSESGSLQFLEVNPGDTRGAKTPSDTAKGTAGKNTAASGSEMGSRDFAAIRQTSFERMSKMGFKAASAPFAPVELNSPGESPAKPGQRVVGVLRLVDDLLRSGQAEDVYRLYRSGSDPVEVVRTAVRLLRVATGESAGESAETESITVSEADAREFAEALARAYENNSQIASIQAEFVREQAALLKRQMEEAKKLQERFDAKKRSQELNLELDETRRRLQRLEAEKRDADQKSH